MEDKTNTIAAGLTSPTR